MTDTTLLEAVREVARVTGRAALRRFRAELVVERKRDGSPVTNADREAERVARDWIEARFPKDGILGEELGEVNPDAERRWIIDPIDGTRSFVRGVPLWGTLVAVTRGAEVLAGAINCAAADELVCAAPGLGCWWNGSRAQVSRVAAVRDALVLTTNERFDTAPARRDGWRALADAAGMVRSWGDCYGYVLVATGRAEVMVDPVLAPWDAAPLVPIVSEAGGVVTDWSGVATAFGGGVVATNASLAAEARTLLGAGAPS